MPRPALLLVPALLVPVLFAACGADHPEDTVDAQPDVPGDVDAAPDDDDAAPAAPDAAAPDAAAPEPDADDSEAAVLVKAFSPTTFAETSGGLDYEVRLARRPIAPVSVAVTIPSGSVAETTTVALSWPTDDHWSDPQRVHVTPVRDFHATGTQDGAIAFVVTSDDPAYAALAPIEEAFEVTDVDVVALHLTVRRPAVTEGECIPMRVRLRSQPNAPVSVALTVSDPTEATVSPTELTFDPAQPISIQQVTVCALVDDGDDGDVEWDLTAQVTASEDPAYLAAPPKAMTITTRDAIDND